ncbi:MULTISPECIES: conjugal transfer protein MobB [Bacteroides]|uniref:conjugal transfer protein MobB n=1 Tax=Bacteroides TaxID=816 RepID=UPI0018A07959|nr:MULTISPECIES: conjugal transfer protein MobB [Bacteroides]MDC2615566.1 conjugal transfer protein MobB [Bacteroides ovatus]MDC2634755.1 conjugal transfer protein MobB [Bacteroides ovatus]
MVANMNVGASLYGALAYNGQKVNEGEGKLLLSNKIFDDGTGTMDIARAASDFERYLPQRMRTEKPIIHISLNPHPDDKLTDTELSDIAREYMEKIGYGEQPYVVFKHEDIDRHHLHIVSIRVGLDGKRLDNDYIHRRSKRATNALEKKYGLHSSGDRKQRQEQAALRKVDVTGGNVKRQVGNVLKGLSENYRFQSLGEYRALLSLYNITVEEARGEVHGREYRGFVYSATDEKGNKVGNPLKASRFGKYAGWDAFDARCAASKDEIQKKELSKYTKGKVSAAMRQASGREELLEKLKAKGVDVVLRETDTGRIYGVTFIDHKTGCVLNGSRMGKELSANALQEWVEAHTPHPTQLIGVTLSPEPQAAEQRQPFVLHRSQSDEDTITGGLFDIPVSQGTDPEEEAFRHRMQRKKKKRKGRGI